MVEIQLTGLEIARLLHRARSLVSHLERPKIGVVTIPNMVGNIQGFEEIFDIELHTYFISGLSEMERGRSRRWPTDGCHSGRRLCQCYCRRLGKRTLFFDGTEDSLRTSLLHARTWGRSPTPSAATRPTCKFCWTTPSTGFWSWTPGNHRPEQRRGL